MDYKIFKGQKKISLWLPVFIIASLLFSSPSASAAIGDLDISFSGDGKVTTAIGARDDGANSMILQSDGKIVVAGYSLIGGNYDFALARYNTNGSLDTSFDTDGKVTTAIGAGDDGATSMILQSDGKIVVAGYSVIGGNYDFALARYNTNGSLDTSFDTDGKVTTAIGASVDLAYSMILQSDGKIVVAGYSLIGANADFALARYNTNGSLDTSFDTDGKVTTAIGASDDAARSVVLQSDGKIVVAGYSFIEANYDFALARYNTDGSLDTSFDTDGKVTTAIGASDDGATSVILQSNGKIVVAGYSFIGGNYDFALARYNTNGSPDTSFDTDGKVTTAIVASDDGASVDLANSMILQSDGKIVVAGYSTTGANAGFALARYIASDSTAPAAPTLNSVTAGDRRVTISFTAGANNGAAITDYEYSLNGGTYVSAGTTTSPFTITGLSGRTAYSVTIKARNSVGLSTASSSLSATTTDASQDASEAAAEVARLAAIEAASVAAAAEVAKKAKEQKELTEILAIIPKIAELTLGLGETTKSLYSTKCVKGKTSKYVKYGAKCPKGYRKK